MGYRSDQIGEKSPPGPRFTLTEATLTQKRPQDSLCQSETIHLVKLSAYSCPGAAGRRGEGQVNIPGLPPASSSHRDFWQLGQGFFQSILVVILIFQIAGHELAIGGHVKMAMAREIKQDGL